MTRRGGQSDVTRRGGRDVTRRGGQSDVARRGGRVM